MKYSDITKLKHLAQDKASRSANPAIVRNSTIFFKNMQELLKQEKLVKKGKKVNFYEYARGGSQTTIALQDFIAELEEAFKRAKKSKKTYVISIHTDGYQWLEGSAYWESPTLGISTTEENKKALKEHLDGKKKQRKGV